MPILLYGVGGLVVAIGAAMIGLGIPNNEFGIGNTLIVAGTTAVAGGLVVAGLGVAVAQLQRIADALATRTPVRSSRPFDTFDPAAAARSPAAQAALPRVPFPPKTKPEVRAQEARVEADPRDMSGREPRFEMPQPAAAPVQDYAAPTLPNPDEPPVTVADEAFLSPLHPAAQPAPFFRGSHADLDRRSAETSLDRRGLDADLDRDEHDAPKPAARKPRTYFDAMWPAEPKPAEPKAAEQKPVEAKSSEFQWSDVRRGQANSADAKQGGKPPVAGDLREPVSERPLDEHAEPDQDDAPRAVAILKSGVVDGMGYTLYVDGSIEAELPQGTLRFASINELRSHLEKTS